MQQYHLRYQAIRKNGGGGEFPEVIKRISTTSPLQHNPLETTAKQIRHPCVMRAGPPRTQWSNVSITLISGPRLAISVD